jgi:hypothetical protein
MSFMTGVRDFSVLMKISKTFFFRIKHSYHLKQSSFFFIKFVFCLFSFNVSVPVVRPLLSVHVLSASIEFFKSSVSF